MLNREEYNGIFKTNLTKEQFDEIMGKPITDVSAIYELTLVDKTGKVWTFVPKETAIPIQWIKEYISNLTNPVYYHLYAKEIEKPFKDMLCKWEKENEDNSRS